MSEYDPSQVIDRLLRQDEEGLKMYLVCRLGGAQQLAEVYDSLRATLADGSASSFSDAPSLKSLAYAAARRLAQGAASPPVEGAFGSIEWMPTPEHASPFYGEVLDRIRLSLDPLTAEVLELQYARALNPDEIAYVLGQQPADAAQRVHAGARSVEQLAEDLGDFDAPVDALIRDAFRPRTTISSAEQLPSSVQGSRLSPGTILGGRFEVATSLQTGPATTSYLANDMSMPGQSVVLQVLHRATTIASARTGLLRRLKVIDSVVHPSIERTLDCGWYQDRLWYATPWYRGHTLRQLVQQRRLSALEVVEIFVPVARGLAALHERGAVHRDVSLDKILLIQVGAETSEETVPLLRGFDAWLADGPFGSDETPHVAPETAQRFQENGAPGIATPSEDVFLLALALLQSLDPGVGEIEPEGWDAFLQTRATRPIKLPSSKHVEPFTPLLTRALSVDPGTRQSAVDLAEGLWRLRARAETARRRRSLVAPISILATLIAILAVVYFTRESRLELIRESKKAVDAERQERELEAESLRSERLEEELDRLREMQR